MQDICTFSSSVTDFGTLIEPRFASAYPFRSSELDSDTLELIEGAFWVFLPGVPYTLRVGAGVVGLAIVVVLVWGVKLSLELCLGLPSSMTGSFLASEREGLLADLVCLIVGGSLRSDACAVLATNCFASCYRVEQVRLRPEFYAGSRLGRILLRITLVLGLTSDREVCLA